MAKSQRRLLRETLSVAQGKGAACGGGSLRVSSARGCEEGAVGAVKVTSSSRQTNGAARNGEACSSEACNSVAASALPLGEAIEAAALPLPGEEEVFEAAAVSSA